MEGIGENERTTEKDRKGQIRQKDRKRQRDKLTDGRDTLYKLAERETNSRKERQREEENPEIKVSYIFLICCIVLKVIRLVYHLNRYIVYMYKTHFTMYV